ncbi:MAG: copper amine oxidase N-terminal domain-containing protein [Tissierellia bacterium]|nr:copper amine oxidase N-terminal domain-containing protein [Tissierellia bacterium]
MIFMEMKGWGKGCEPMTMDPMVNGKENNMKIKNMIKKATVGVLLCTMTIQPMVQAAPSEAIEAFKKAPIVEASLQKFNKEIKIYMIQNGEKTRIDTKLKDGIRVLNERTSVGVRDLAELIPGTRVEWDGANQVVDIYAGEKNIAFPLNKKIMYDGSRVKDLDTQAAVDYAIERTFLPIRTIAEALGYTVDWDAKESAVLLVAPGETIANTTQPTENKDPNRPKNAEGYYTTTKKGKRLLTAEESKKSSSENNVFFCLNDYVTEEDFEVLPNGNILMLRGTELETEFHAPFKQVVSSSPNPNFKVLEPNPNDPRVGTYVYGKGSKFWNEGRPKKNNSKNKTDRRPNMRVINTDKAFYDLIADRRLNDIESAAKVMNAYVGSGADHMDMASQGNIILYDITGLFDVSLQNSRGGYDPTMCTYDFNSLYILKDGRVIKPWDIKKGDVIDKVASMPNTQDYQYIFFISDVPDITVRTDRWVYYIKDILEE